MCVPAVCNTCLLSLYALDCNAVIQHWAARCNKPRITITTFGCHSPVHGLSLCYLNELCIPVLTVPVTFLFYLPLPAAIWSYPEQGCNSATGHLCGWSGRPEQSTTGHSFVTYIINFQKHAQDTTFLTFLLH